MSYEKAIKKLDKLKVKCRFTDARQLTSYFACIGAAHYNDSQVAATVSSMLRRRLSNPR